jgi:hypothetical protein
LFCGNRLRKNKYLGVFFNSKRKTKPWRADYANMHLGHYKFEESAAFAYNQKAIELFGPNGYLFINNRAVQMENINLTTGSPECLSSNIAKTVQKRKIF